MWPTEAVTTLHRKTLTGTLFGGLKAKFDVPILLKRYLRLCNLNNWASLAHSFLRSIASEKPIFVYNADWHIKIKKFDTFALCLFFRNYSQLDEFVTHEMKFKDINREIDLFIRKVSLDMTLSFLPCAKCSSISYKLNLIK